VNIHVCQFIPPASNVSLSLGFYVIHILKRIDHSSYNLLYRRRKKNSRGKLFVRSNEQSIFKFLLFKERKKERKKKKVCAAVVQYKHN
jgi:hypothetical protein